MPEPGSGRAPTEEGNTPSWDLVERLEETWAVLDGVLSSLPPTRLELKRVLERKLGFTPGAELLQAMVRVSEERVHDPRIANLVRGILVVHVTAESELHRFLRAPLRDVETIRRTTVLLGQLRDAFHKLGAEANDAARRTDPSSRSHLERLRRWLAISEERFAEPLVLGPHLRLLAEAVGAEGLAKISLREGEIEMVQAAYHGGEAAEGAARGTVDGIALRLRMEEDLAAWRELPPPDEEDDAASEERLARFERLRADRVAYHAVSNRLQALRDTRFRSGRVRDADVLRVTLRVLFALYLNVSRVLGAGPMAVAEQAEISREDEAALAEEMRLAEEQAARVDAQSESRKELVREAVSGAGAPRSKRSRGSTAADVRKLRRRRQALLAVAGMLAVAAVGVNAALWRPSALSPEISPREFESAMFVSEAVQVGELMCSSTSRRVWESMDRPERIKRVRNLANLARQRGIQEIVLEDEQHRELAHWSAAKGVELTP